MYVNKHNIFNIIFLKNDFKTDNCNTDSKCLHTSHYGTIISEAYNLRYECPIDKLCTRISQFVSTNILI